jgi:hypothetical protein
MVAEMRVSPLVNSVTNDGPDLLVAPANLL